MRTALLLVGLGALVVGIVLVGTRPRSTESARSGLAGGPALADHFPLAKIGVPAVSLSTPAEFTGQTAALAKTMHDEYNAKRYHQPSDEIQPDWDYSAAVADMRLLAELGWQIATLPEMPSYHPREAFARPRSAGAR